MFLPMPTIVECQSCADVDVVTDAELLIYMLHDIYGSA